MIVSLDEAQEIYEDLPSGMIAPTLSPSFVHVDSLREEGLEAKFFLYREKTKTFLLPFHLRHVEEFGFYDVQSQYGYGGPCYNVRDDEFLSRAWSEFLVWCIESRVWVCFFRFHPLLENERMFPGAVMENRKTVSIKLAENYFDEFQPKTRTKIRALQKMGVHSSRLDCNTVENTECFVEAYEDTMIRAKADSEYFFSKPYWEALFRLSSAQLYVAKSANVALCYVFALVTNSSIAEYFLAASTQQGYELGAMPFLINETCSFLINKGKEFLHLGGGADQDENSNLLMFKKKFSRNIGSYKIGSLILNKDAYETLRNTMNYNGNRVIFYR